MKAVLYLLKFISGLIFGFSACWALAKSESLVINLILLLSASVIVAFSKAITFNKNTEEIKFKTKEFSKLFFTEELIKVTIVMAVTLWYNKFISGLKCFLIILSSFVVLILLMSLYYWLLKQKRVKKLTK